MSKIADYLRAKNGFTCLGAVSKEAIDAAEQELHLAFANDYRDYVCDCGVVSYDGHELTGVCSSPRLNVVDVTIKERVNNPLVQAHMYVVEQTHYDNVVIWQSSIGEIYQSQHGKEPIQIAGSLAEYLGL